MFSNVLIHLVLYYFTFISTRPVSIYRNAQFNPIDNHFLSANLSSIESENICICQCLTNSMCLTATYNGYNHTCLLYFAQIYEGQLQLMTMDSISSVIYLNNKTISAPSIINAPNETVYGIWNTIVGGNSSVATAGNSTGNYNTGEPPSAVFDYITSTNYNSFGSCNLSFSALSCGEKTGFYVTLKNGPSLLRGFRIRSGHYQPTRDPLIITIESSNQPSSFLTFGSSWTLIYNGSSGLDIDPGRSLFGQIQNLTANSIWYSSYRFLVTTKRTSEVAVEYSEIQFFGY